MCECDLSPRNVKRLSWVIVSLQPDCFCISHPTSGRKITLPSSAVWKYRLLLFERHSHLIRTQNFIISLMFFQISSATYLEIKHAPFCLKGNVNSKSASERIPNTTQLRIPVLFGIDEPCEDRRASVLFTKPWQSHPLVLCITHSAAIS